jgi:hypothetical protein
MPGPAWFSGTMNIAKNEDWKVALIYQIDYTDYSVAGATPNIQPLDLTGSSFLMQIRKVEEDQTALVSVSTDPDGGIVITNAYGGQFEITISIAKATRLEPGEYVADLLRTDANGFAERVFDLACTVVDGTSRTAVGVMPYPAATSMRAQQQTRARSVRR